MVSRIGLCVLLFVFLGLAGPTRCIATSHRTVRALSRTPRVSYWTLQNSC